MRKLRYLSAAALSVAMLIVLPVSCRNKEKPDGSYASHTSPVILEAQINERLPTYRFELSKKEEEEHDAFRYELSMELTDNGTKCIYKGKCSSLNEEQSTRIENYLRFGVPNPITSEQALQIAAEKHSGAELQLVQMLTFGGRSYYHISWSNGSETGDCGVSTDGKESIDCKPYLEELRARAVPAFNRTGDTV